MKSSISIKFPTIFVVVLFLCFLTSCESSDCDSASENDEAPKWIKDGGIIFLVLGVCTMFWGLALVCEEYFVPALNIMCEELNIPDDVAGATFMAAGASSPEMFTSFIALFVNHSAIGVGTVVGSEIFNHMIICSGSVMYSTTGVLQLEKRVFSRDVCAYFASLIVLIWALKGNLFQSVENMFKKGEQEKCLNVTIYHAFGLVLLYCLYAVVSGNFQRLVQNMCPMSPKETEVALGDDEIAELFPVQEEGDEEDTGSSDHVVDFLAKITESPMIPPDVSLSVRKGTNTHQSMVVRRKHNTETAMPSSQSMVLRRSMQAQRSLKYNPNLSRGGGGHSGRLVAVDWSESRASFVPDTPLFTWRSSAVHIDTRMLGDAEYKQTLEGVVQMKSSPLLPPPDCTQSLYRAMSSADALSDLASMGVSEDYFGAYLYSRGPGGSWKLRYFTIDRLGFHSRKAVSNPIRGPHIKSVDMRGVSRVSMCRPAKNVFQLSDSKGEVVMELSAPTDDICSTAFERMEALVLKLKSLSAEEIEEQGRINKRVLEGGAYETNSGEDDSHGCLLDKPISLSGDPYGPIAVIWHYTVFPLKFLFYYTLADVHTKAGRDKYIGCLISSIVWLALLSFVMIQCCDGIGNFIGASPIVMGLTLSAVGTSFPNLWSSMLVARQGLGDMAVSNAFGSNTFNICIALGLPWLTHVLVYDMNPYDKMQDDGIVFMLLLLVVVLVVFYVVVWLHDWQIRLWMSYYFIFTYVGIMVYAILNG